VEDVVPPFLNSTLSAATTVENNNQTTSTATTNRTCEINPEVDLTGVKTGESDLEASIEAGKTVGGGQGHENMMPYLTVSTHQRQSPPSV